MQELGITLVLQHGMKIQSQLKESNCTVTNSYFMHDSPAVKELTDRVKQILDAKYEKADLSKLVSKMTYLSNEEQASLLKLLLQHLEIYLTVP
jgi:ABC-type uncharacterized transport system ATPase subunit